MGDVCGWIKAAEWIAASLPRLTRRAEDHQLQGELCYAEGGARPARRSETSSSAAVTTGRESYQPEIRGAEAIPLNVAVSAGACSDWQIWQALSGPPLCWCRRLPPPAKYSNARHTIAAANRRNRFPVNILLPSLISEISVYTTPCQLDAAKPSFVAISAILRAPVLDPITVITYPLGSVRICVTFVPLAAWPVCFSQYSC